MNTVFRRRTDILHESVPSSQVSLHHRCPCITGVPASQVSLHHRCPCITGVPSSQVSLHHRCPCITGVPASQVSLHHRCPFITCLQVSLHTGVPSSQVLYRGEDRTPFWVSILWSEVVLSSKSPLKTSFTLIFNTYCEQSLHTSCPQHIVSQIKSSTSTIWYTVSKNNL